MEKKPVSHFIVGLVIALVLIIIFLALYFTGNSFKKNVVSYLPSAAFIGGIIYAIINYSKANDHNVSFSSCFTYGFKASAIVALVMAAFLFLFLTVFPDYKESFLQFMSSELDNSNTNLSDDQKETSLKMMGKVFSISVIGGGLFMNLLIGLIASLIGAAVAKKNPRNPFVQQG